MWQICTDLTSPSRLGGPCEGLVRITLGFAIIQLRQLWKICDLTSYYREGNFGNYGRKFVIITGIQGGQLIAAIMANL